MHYRAYACMICCPVWWSATRRRFVSSSVSYTLTVYFRRLRPQLLAAMLNGHCVSIPMYADNILLLTPTVSYTTASLECMSVWTADIADYFCNLSKKVGVFTLLTGVTTSGRRVWPKVSPVALYTVHNRNADHDSKSGLSCQPLHSNSATCDAARMFCVANVGAESTQSSLPVVVS